MLPVIPTENEKRNVFTQRLSALFALLSNHLFNPLLKRSGDFSSTKVQHSSRTAKFANVVNMGCLAWLTKIDPVVDLPIRMAQCFQ
jgi:hypothetical protein